MVDLDPQRECPSCALEAPADAEACPYCGYEFPVPKAGVRPMGWVMIALMILFAIPLLAWLFG
ncbi:MAG: zinc ribbon domain-containing protein [Rubricoccaceae bacterium]|nr:zinc ribbon domain-containing protein [Rubricoccaceae bacterium]